MQKVMLLLHINCEIFAWFFICMKIVMFNRTKNRVYWLLLLPILAIYSIWYTNAETFTERLEQIWLDVATFSSKKSVSRYEIARLLNAANCEDCIQAPDWMKNSYNKSFWDGFKAIDWKDFNDINYLWAMWNRKSYYYCVAYIWDNGYMAWYPSTSTKCQWNFCGQDSITVSEVYQTILNITQDQIRQKYQINWSDVKSWMKWLNKTKRTIILNQTNIDAIDKADVKSTYAQTNDEFQAWLKYCMYNLSWCNFQSFGKIWQAYWPVSELNILYKEWMITAEDAENVYTNPSINWADALRLFELAFDHYASCSFNVDYDCDWVTNGKDNCPYVYNLNQYDEDWDWVWNVCDDDIDWDGKKNPMWIVDDNNHIVISIWDNNLDQTPLGDWDLWFSFFIDVESITAWLPAAVTFSPLTDWDISSIEWDFGDGTTQKVGNWNKVKHVFRSSWNFIVKATATSKNGWKSFAMTKIFIANEKWKDYLLNISPSFVFKNWSVEYTLTALYSGDIDRISWDVNNAEEKSQKVWEKYKFTVKEDWLYVVNAKWYKNWELKSVAMLTLLQKWSPSLSTMTFSPAYLWDDLSVTTNLMWVLKKDVDYINIDWGWQSTSSSNLIQKHAYNEWWLKTIQQAVTLKDWTTLYSIATVTIQNPNLLQSYALNVEWKRLSYNQNEKMSLWLSMYPNSSVVSLFTSYQAGKKDYVVNPNFGNKVLDFSYATAWDKILTNSVEVNKCVAVMNQGTVHINSVDVCLAVLKNNKVSNYRCDMDWDKIPDICDDDIDWDGKKNLLWIINRENKDCSITSSNINVEILRKQFWVCSLDNCPFGANEDQTDLNNNGVWDVCESSMSKLLRYSVDITDDESWVLTLDLDADQDGIPDSKDACPSVPWNSADGCPQYSNQNCWLYSSCGNGKIEPGETCLNCPQDAGSCCWNGKIETRETCDTCPEDLWDNCKPDVNEWECGDGNVDKWENCRNCKEDLKDCIPTCGDKKYDKWETCNNCPEDLWVCPNSCGNGRVEAPEQCDHGILNGKDGECSEECISLNPLCWNKKVEKWEECDYGENNGKFNNWTWCTIACKWFNPAKPNCWNGIYEQWENCLTCPEDLWWACRWKCGDGVLNVNEECDNGEDNGHDGICTFECKKATDETKYCGNSKIEKWEECDHGILNGKDWECSKECKNVKKEWKCWNGVIEEAWWEECDMWDNNGKEWVNCTKECKYKNKCGNGWYDGVETCDTCPEDLWDNCKPDVNEWECGDGKIDKWETCGNCPEDVGRCCWNSVLDPWEDCDTCPQDANCDKCGNGEKDEWETCDTCPEDFGGCVKSAECNSCPCEYVDFSTDLSKWDTIRAKLWDRQRSVFYNYSNIVAIENYLNGK